MSDPNGKMPEEEAAEAQLRPVHHDPSIAARHIAQRLTDENLKALAGRHGEVEQFIDTVLLAKPCSPVTRRAISIILQHSTAEIARLTKEHQSAVERVQQEHRATLEQLAEDAAVSEGIDLTMYQLQAPGDVPPYWKPR